VQTCRQIPEGYCRCHKNPPSDPIHSQTNLTHTLPTFFLRYILILSSHLRLGLLVVSPFKLPDQNFVHSHHFHACYMPRPSHSPWVYEANSICWRSQIMKFLKHLQKCPSFNVTDKISHPYKTTSQLTTQRITMETIFELQLVISFALFEPGSTFFFQMAQVTMASRLWHPRWCVGQFIFCWGQQRLLSAEVQEDIPWQAVLKLVLTALLFHCACTRSINENHIWSTCLV
jgi:hypothetical protein